jgi:hypothetical protein
MVSTEQPGLQTGVTGILREDEAVGVAHCAGRVRAEKR